MITRCSSIPAELLPPQEVGIELTTRCNYHCCYCYMNYRDEADYSDMPIDLLRTLLAQLSRMGVTAVTFAGGEPCLYSHLTDAISMATSLGLSINVDTNGSLLETLDSPCLALMRKGNVRMFVSLPSFDPETYFTITGSELSGVLKGISHVLALQLPVFLVNVLSRHNITVPPQDYLDKARSLGCTGIRILKCNLSPQAVSCHEFKEHYLKFCQVRHSFSALDIHHEFRKVCKPLIQEMGITVDGRILACPYNDKISLGRVSEVNPLTSVLSNNPIAEQIMRTQAADPGFLLDSFGYCGALCSLVTDEGCRADSGIAVR